MKKTYFSILIGLLVGLFATSWGFSEVLICEPFENGLSNWNEGTPPEIPALQALSAYNTVFFTSEVSDTGRLESNVNVPLTAGTVVEFDVQIPYPADDGSTDPMAVVAFGKGRGTALSLNDWWGGFAFSNSSGGAYFFTTTRELDYTLVPIEIGIWHHVKMEIVKGGYGELSIDNVRAARSQAVMGPEDGEVPLIINARWASLDNVMVGTRPQDGQFVDTFDETLGSNWQVAGDPASYISGADGRLPNAFHTTNATLLDASAKTVRTFQVSAGVTATFEAKVANYSKAMAVMGFMKSVSTSGGEILACISLHNDMKTVGWYADGEYNDEASLDNEWHTYAIEIDQDTMFVYKDGYCIDKAVAPFYLYPNAPAFISCTNAYIDNVSIK